MSFIKCPVTGSDDWENIDQFRIKPHGMSINKTSGFVSYPNNPHLESKEHLKKFYRDKYRSVPTVQNLFQGQLKNWYHTKFLHDLVTGWRESKRPVRAFDVGAAYGLFLQWFRGIVPQAEVSGYEPTLSYQRVAYHHFGIDVTRELPDEPAELYDFICCYHTLEHLLNPLDELLRMKKNLNDDGYLYVSVPTWFRSLSNFGDANWDLEYYYAPPHINVWTREFFESLLARAGLKVVKEDHIIYCDTYLLQKSDEITSDLKYPGYQEIRERVERIFQFSKAFESRDFDKATKLWPNCPYLYRYMYEINRAKLHPKGWQGIKNEFLLPALHNTENDKNIRHLYANVAMRYEEWSEALQMLESLLADIPNAGDYTEMMSSIFRQMAERESDPGNRIVLLKKAREVTQHLYNVSLMRQHDCITWLYRDESLIPMPSETI